MDREHVAAVLEEIGVLLELKGENPFKTRAYAYAARALETLTEPLDHWWPSGGSERSRGLEKRSSRRSPSW
jgi:DNA polymerase (family X)